MNGVFIEDFIERLRGFGEDALQSTSWENDAGLVFAGDAVNNGVVAFGKSDYFTQRDLFEGSSEGEPTADPAAGGNKAMTGKLVNHFGEVIPGNLK